MLNRASKSTRAAKQLIATCQCACQRSYATTSGVSSVLTGVDSNESDSDPSKQAQELAVRPGDEKVLTPRQIKKEQARQEALQAIKERKHRRATTDLLENLGSVQAGESAWKPRDSLKHPPAPPALTLSHLVAAGAHLGHSKTFTHKAARSLVYGHRAGVSYIDLRQTLPALRRAAQVVRGVVERDGLVVFLGSLQGTRKAVMENAARLGPNGFGATKWLPGTISNASSVYTYAEIPETAQGEKGVAAVKPRFGAGADRSPRSKDKVTPWDFKPSLIVCLSPPMNTHAIREATAHEIPTIGITDTNMDPRAVTYSIPANDDSIRTVELIAGVLGMAGKEGLELKNQRMAREAATAQRRSAAGRTARLTRQ